MPIDRITIRLPSTLRTAAEGKASAADQTLTDYIRGLLETATGLPHEPVKQGVAALTMDQRQARAREALAAKKAKKARKTRQKK